MDLSDLPPSPSPGLVKASIHTAVPLTSPLRVKTQEASIFQLCRFLSHQHIELLYSLSSVMWLAFGKVEYIIKSLTSYDPGPKKYLEGDYKDPILTLRNIARRNKVVESLVSAGSQTNPDKQKQNRSQGRNRQIQHVALPPPV